MLERNREAIAKIANDWGSAKNYGVIWGLIYVGDCIRELTKAIRDQSLGQTK